MKNILSFLTILFFCGLLFSACSSKNGKVSSLQATEKGDQVAQENVVFTEKKVITSAEGKPTEYQYIFKNKVIAKEILNEKGEIVSVEGEIPNGLIKEYNVEGKLVSEKNYNAGKLEGVNKTFYSDETTVATVKNYKNGVLEGKVFEYYENGNKKLEANYKNGLLNGTLKKYSTAETLLSSANYVDGKLDGLYKEFFVTGKPKKEIEYYNGLKEGYSKEYFSNGTLKYQYNYSQDKLEGDSQIYYEDGSINEIRKYQNNKLNGETKIYSNNNSEIPLYIDTYVNDKKVLRRAFSSNGRQIFKIKY